MAGDRPISPRLPLLAGTGLLVAGVALFAAGAPWSQRLGLGLVTLGAGVALLGSLLRAVRVLHGVRGSPVWSQLPRWIRVTALLHPIGYAIGPVLLIGAGLFFVAAALLRL